MLQRLWKKRLAAVAFVGALAVTGAAVAYFTGGTGNGTGSGTVGTSSQWSVAATGTPTFSGSLTAIYPGAGTEFIPFTATNNGNGHQAVTSVTVSLPHQANGDAQTAAGADIPGCLAAWFTPTVDSGNPTLPSDVAPAGTYQGKVDLTMQNLTTTDQSACKSAAPAVTITVS